MKSYSLALLAIPLILLDPWAGPPRPTVAEEAAVKAVVQHYVDAVIRGSSEALERAVAGGAVDIGVGPQGEVCLVPLAARTGPWWMPGRRVEPRITVLAVDGRSAVVRAELRGRRVSRVAYLSLLKVDDGWTIVNRLSSPPTV